MKNVFVTVIVVLLLEAAAWVVMIYSGVYDVSMANHDNGFVNWAFDTGTTRSVKHHALAVSKWPLNDPAMIREGREHFQEMCAMCHGAPGVEPGEIAQGLWPPAPDLRKVGNDWKPNELFWIIKNGIKFTAMPAWGPSHGDEKIWALVAFVRKLPDMSADDYNALGQSESIQTNQMNAPAESLESDVAPTNSNH